MLFTHLNKTKNINLILTNIKKDSIILRIKKIYLLILSSK